MPIFLLPIVLPILIVSIVFHEVAHGWTALWFGDTTAKDAGRLTLNPLAHLDLFGSLIIPVLCLLFGLPIFAWAKPVPVDFSRLNRKAALCVSLAGVAVNFLIAIAASLVFRWLVWQWPAEAAVSILLLLAVWINILLAAFNLLPIPPLDGWRIWGIWLPLRWRMAIEMNALIFLVLLLIFFRYLPILFLVRTLFFVLTGVRW